MKLKVTPILREVWRAYRAHWKILIPLSMVVLLPQSVLDALVGDIQIEGIHHFTDVAKLASIPLTLAVNLAGEALFAGIVAALIVDWRAERDHESFRDIAAEVPYGRLIGIDLLIAIGTTIAFVFFILPGIAAFTYTLIAPALIELNNLSIRDALMRSIQLVKGNFWRVLGFAAIIYTLSDLVSAVLESPIHGVKGEVLFNLLIHAALEPFQGLAVVLLALGLMDLHGIKARRA